jgi:oligopeptide/dipeptide ABC transporter ATP-binding protein
MENIREKVLEIHNLRVSFFLKNKTEIKAVNDLSFDIMNGELLGLAGESGSGKTVVLKSIFKIVPPPGRILGGEIIFKGNDILLYSEKEMRQLRGKTFSMVFQEPMSALNPSFTVRWQIEEIYKLHGRYTRKERQEMALEMMRLVKIPNPEKRINEFPFQFSGGMQQRVLIAIALACNPTLLFADEPTTALDVTVQADIMDLLESLRKETNISMMLISHNLNLLVERCERIIVMYSGQLMEIAKTADIIINAAHPYTIGLLNSTVDIEQPDMKYTAIPGDISDVAVNSSGCAFAPRCKRATSVCYEQKPSITVITPGHICHCHNL